MGESIPPGTYDYIVSSSMLEHTKHPWRVVAEMFKLLKSDGIVYISVPFLYPFHDEPHDYWRLSVNGLTNLVTESGFEVIESGSLISPHGALYDFLKVYLSEIFSFNNSVIFYMLNYLLTWILFPIGIFEWLFPLGKRSNYYTDAIVYVVARKK